MRTTKENINMDKRRGEGGEGREGETAEWFVLLSNDNCGKRTSKKMREKVKIWKPWSLGSDMPFNIENKHNNGYRKNRVTLSLQMSLSLRILLFKNFLSLRLSHSTLFLRLSPSLSLNMSHHLFTLSLWLPMRYCLWACPISCPSHSLWSIPITLSLRLTLKHSPAMSLIRSQGSTCPCRYSSSVSQHVPLPALSLSMVLNSPNTKSVSR